jgi:hypothetical protein
MVEDHPKAIAAREQAKLYKEVVSAYRAGRRAALDELTRVHRLKFVDLKPFPDAQNIGMTIAYTDDGRILRVGTSLRNPSDQYNKMEGRVVAARSFSRGNFVLLRKPKGVQTAKFIRTTFETY